MSCWSKEELENMLEDVVNELDLSGEMIEKHGPLGTAPAELVRLVLDRKDQELAKLRNEVSSLRIERNRYKRMADEGVTDKDIVDGSPDFTIHNP